MNIAVIYMAQLKTAAGTGSEVVRLPPSCSVQELVRQLAARHGPDLQHLLLTAEGHLQPTILLFLNDQQVQQPDRTALKDGDQLTLLSPIAGG